MFNPDMNDEDEMRAGALGYAEVMIAQMNDADLFRGRWAPQVIKTDAGIHSLIGIRTASGSIEVSLHPVTQQYIAIINDGNIQHRGIGDNMEQTLIDVLNSQTKCYAYPDE